MTIGLCPAFVPGQQYFDNDGNVLAGGLLSCSVVSYTSKTGAVLNTNPIVLDASGRMRGEIWLEFGANATFTLKTALGATIGSWSNIYPYNDTAIPQVNDVAFNSSIGINNILPQSSYSQSSSPKTALTTAVPQSYAFTGTPSGTIVMAAYPRIFAKDFSAVKMGVKNTYLTGSAPFNFWRFLVYEANADGSPGNSVVDTGIFNLSIVDGFISKTISYTFKANTIYWFAIAWNYGVPAGFEYYTIGNIADGNQFSIGTGYNTGYNPNNEYNYYYLGVLNSVTTNPSSSLLTNNPPVSVDFYGFDYHTAPIFYLHSA